MAEYTIKEFASLCHTSEAVIRTNKARGKIVIFQKLIDYENPINQVFFNKYYNKFKADKKKKNETKGVQELYNNVVEKVEIQAKKKITKEEREKQRKESVKQGKIVSSWDLRKKKADALLQERRAEKELVTLEKLAGKLIPVDLIFNIIRIHNQSIFATFQNDTENLASIFCDILASGDRKKLSEITEKISERLSTGVKRAEEVALSSIENAIEEYSDTRNRGERK